MQKNIKISPSPEMPMLEVVDKMVMKIASPYSKDEVHIQFNPNIQEYKEKADRPSVKVRQFMVTKPTDQTKVLKFDFKENNAHDVEVEGTKYNVKLLGIGSTTFDQQDFLTFEFHVSW